MVLTDLVFVLSDVNIAGEHNVTPLHIAAKYNQLAAVRALIACNADVQSGDINLNTPLHYAAKAGHQDICKELLNNQPFMIDNKNKKEMTALHLACIHNRNFVCSYLVEKGTDVTTKTEDGSIPIHIAASRGNTELMEIFLDAGMKNLIARIDHLSRRNYDGASILHRAVQCGQEQVVMFCLNEGVETNVCDKKGLTPLHIAAINGNDSISRILLTKRSTIDARDNYDRTPLHHAASLNRLNIAEVLINAGAGINISDSKQTTPLLYAIANNHLQSAQLLINHNCSIKAVDQFGRNCLHIAAIGSDDDLNLLEYLLSVGNRIILSAH
ncbi:Ankyrin repeat, PH and SEC7 domain containing protein secG [Trichoplax sp. H2]|nr:Ankyrin repeat, PH and SEC7 domain containing protein secG [Trichoplax sp. H2]|eukprot:RDD38698.1 Ankyrin repeat, PH and SEC7 domain containing protein secG [Trichoplax sp. H2]